MTKFLIKTKSAVRFLKLCFMHLIKSMTVILKDKTGHARYPAEVVESLARVFYPLVVEFFEKEENKKEYEEWAKERELKKTKPNN